jgi:diaminohydroxyphosphoribosylaminopyrimidine deaminase/5-amino-6-(5-phosphoribosylamino)uracil reductase
MRDPNPKVNGRGIRKLQEAGIKVAVGMLEDEASALNEAYIKYITTKRPLVILKTAMTLDGKIANPAGQSKWITGEKARLLVHRMRGRVDAVLTAIGTVKADNPELTARIKGGKDPVRVLIDPGLEVPLDARMLNMPPQTVIITRVENDKANKLYNSGIKVILYKDKLELDWLMFLLADMGVLSVLIEGGSSLNAHALEEQVVDRVMFFIAPKILGGRESYPAVGGTMSRTLDGAFRLRDMKVRRIGEDILVEGRVVYP